jgi:hypothetical protein
MSQPQLMRLSALDEARISRKFIIIGCGKTALPKKLMDNTSGDHLDKTIRLGKNSFVPAPTLTIAQPQTPSSTIAALFAIPRG